MVRPLIISCCISPSPTGVMCVCQPIHIHRNLSRKIKVTICNHQTDCPTLGILLLMWRFLTWKNEVYHLWCLVSLLRPLHYWSNNIAPQTHIFFQEDFKKHTCQILFLIWIIAVNLTWTCFTEIQMSKFVEETLGSFGYIDYGYISHWAVGGAWSFRITLTEYFRQRYRFSSLFLLATSGS